MKLEGLEKVKEMEAAFSGCCAAVEFPKSKTSSLSPFSFEQI